MPASIMIRARAASLLVGTVFLALTACTSGDDAPTATQPVPTPSPAPAAPTVEQSSGVSAMAFTASASPLLRDSMLAIPFTLTRGGGFAGPIDVTLGTLPDGVAGTLLPAQLAAGIVNGVLTLRASAQATVGSSIISVRARGMGLSLERSFAVTVTVAEQPAFSLTVTGSNFTVRAGESVTSALTVARSGGFTGSVQLTSSPAAGITVSFAPSPVSGATATATIAVERTVAAGSYPITIRATSAAPPIERIVSITLVVTSAAPTGSFALSVAPSPVPVSVGGATSASVSIVRNGGFTGPVQLELSSVPSGITATLSATTVSGTSASMLVTATSGVAAGTYSFTLRGVAPGIATVQQPVSVSVSGNAGGGSGIQIRYCPGTDQPLWFAVQDGNGAWSRVFGSGGVFSFPLQSSRGGIAALTQRNGARYLKVEYLSRDELRQRSGTICSLPDPRIRSARGTIARLAAGEEASVSLAFGGAAVKGPGQDIGFTLNSMVAGASTLVAARLRQTTVNGISGSTTTMSADRVILRRGINPASGASLPTLDFNASEAVELSTRRVQVQGASGTPMIGTNLFYTFDPRVAQDGIDFSGAVLGSAVAQQGTSTLNLATVPTRALSPGDIYVLTLVANPGLADARSAFIVTESSADLNVTMGGALRAPSLSSRTVGATLLPRAEGAVHSDYDGDYAASFQSLTGGGARVEVTESGAYRAGNASYLLALPDLSAASGWDPSFGLSVGMPYFWTLSALSQVQPIADGTSRGGQVTRFASTASVSGMFMRGRGDVSNTTEQIPFVVRQDMLDRQRARMRGHQPGR